MEDAPSSLFAGMRDRGLTHFSWNFYLEFWFRRFLMIFDETGPEGELALWSTANAPRVSPKLFFFDL